LWKCEGKIVTREEVKSRLWANYMFLDFDQSWPGRTPLIFTARPNQMKWKNTEIALK